MTRAIQVNTFTINVKKPVGRVCVTFTINAITDMYFRYYHIKYLQIIE